MTLPGAALTLVVYLAGLFGSIMWATSCGATRLLGLVLWTSFFGSCMVLFLMLFWSREHWME